MKLATATADLAPEIREAVQVGWHVMCATADDPEDVFCVEVRRLDGDRFAGPLIWHPHAHRVDLDEWVEFTGWQHVWTAHPADRHPSSGIGGTASA